VADEALQDLSVIELRQLGGALGRPAPAGHGALAQVDAGWALFAGGVAPDGEADSKIRAALATVRERLAPFAAEQVLLNACEAGVDPARAFAPDVWARLARAREAYDPDRLIVAAHGG
jgi:hypothetical protein